MKKLLIHSHLAGKDVVLEGGREAGGDDGDMHLPVVRSVDYRAEYHVGGRVRQPSDHLRHPAVEQSLYKNDVEHRFKDDIGAWICQPSDNLRHPAAKR